MSLVANFAVLTIAIGLLAYVPLGNAQPTGINTMQISVSNGARFGTEGKIEYCPNGSYAVGFFIKVEPPQGPNADDTALNGITLICNDAKQTKISSLVGQWGTNTTTQMCPSEGHLIGFRLRVEPIKGFGNDDTAANDIDFACSDGTELKGNSSTPWGTWGEWSRSCYTYGIIGIRTQVESSQGGIGDDTALNNVVFDCRV